ncbi:MAG: hypothetical protein ACRDKX_08130 [Solirubrobacterales bacterium]
MSRSKKRRKRRPRSTAAPKPAAPKRADAPRSRRSIDDERPAAPWGSFPLVELVVLVGIVMLIAGFVAGGTRGTTLIGTGIALAALAGLELSIREHFAGFRSHTTLLAAVAAAAVAGALYFLAEPSAGVSVGAAAAAFGLAAWALTRAFRARSGRAFKLR